jgi:LuxR family transcriptional regulator, maltose regulon positive regulatory protein
VRAGRLRKDARARGRVTATPAAWVSLDRDDNDASRFWSAVLSAMAECVPDDSPLWDLAPPAVADEPGFLAEIVDALDALDSPLRLVLDDVWVSCAHAVS